MEGEWIQGRCNDNVVTPSPSFKPATREMPYPPLSQVVNAECIIYDRVCQPGNSSNPECATSSSMVNTRCADGDRQALDVGDKTG